MEIVVGGDAQTAGEFNGDMDGSAVCGRPQPDSDRKGGPDCACQLLSGLGQAAPLVPTAVEAADDPRPVRQRFRRKHREHSPHQVCHTAPERGGRHIRVVQQDHHRLPDSTPGALCRDERAARQGFGRDDRVRPAPATDLSGPRKERTPRGSCGFLRPTRNWHQAESTDILLRPRDSSRQAAPHRRSVGERQTWRAPPSPGCRTRRPYHCGPRWSGTGSRLGRPIPVSTGPDSGAVSGFRPSTQLVRRSPVSSAEVPEELITSVFHPCGEGCSGAFPPPPPGQRLSPPFWPPLPLSPERRKSDDR